MNVFSKRILPAYLFNKNPEAFLQWQGNICKQTAILSTFIIKHYLKDEYKIEAWEGFFEHKQVGSYNHCWNYLIHKTDPKKNIICDFTSTITYMDYDENNDPSTHIRNWPDAVVKHQENITMVGSQEIDIETEYAGLEFYTHLRGDEIKEELIHIMKYAKLWENEKDNVLYT